MDSFNCSLSSSLRLATSINSEAAYRWGKAMCEKSSTASYDKSHITLCTYVLFLEQFGHHEEVDALLEGRQNDSKQLLNQVLLGSLLNSAAVRGAWRRAEAIWRHGVRQKVEPNVICHDARAKAHLLAGRPTFAVKVLQGAIKENAASADSEFCARLVQTYVQALLVVCHSSLDLDDLHHLAKVLQHGMTRPRTTVHMILQKMQKAIQVLRTRPSQLRLHDVLIEWNAKEMSAMASWDNFAAGSQYLLKLETSSD